MRLQPLKGYNAFSTVFRNGKKFSNGMLTAFIVFVQSGNEHIPLQHGQQIVGFGVTAKKRTRPAVLRNRIKRLLRESFRQISRDNRATETISSIREIIFIWNAIPPKPSLLRLYEVRESVSDILARAEQFRRKAQEL